MPAASQTYTNDLRLIYLALETIPLSSLLEMDHTYLSRIKLRRELMSAHPKSTLACNPVAEPAALELYSWLMNTYLPKRFPTCYELITQKEKDSSDPSSQGNPTHLLNKITSEPIPLHPASPLAALHTISAHIDTDFLILLPKDRPQTTTTTDQQPPSQSDQPQQEIYHLQAFATTFPSGFSTLSKLSLPLSSIHAPVPSYGPKLQKSMDRFFASLPAGKLVRRANWTITTTPALFTESGTHIHSAEEAREAAQGQREELDVEEMRLRCERQTLHRLPGSGALVFAFKTYLYGLGEVKKEGSGEALAEATEGFKRGSVPEMEVYKRAVVWGEVVRGFLRS